MSELRRNWRVGLRRLAGDQRGAVMAIVGLAIIPLFAVIGLSIDSGRGYMLKSKLSYAIDAAGLAGGRAFDTDLREDDIAMFFEANFPPGYMGSVLAPGHPLVTFDDEESTITIEATATIPTRFMSVAGVHEMSVSARTVIQRELQGMELVLVMDNTGSMRGNGGMVGDEAGRDRADRHPLRRPRRGRELLRRPGALRRDRQHRRRSHDWLTGYDADDFAPTTWKGCVEARAYPNDSNDATPDEEGWQPFLWESTLRKYWSDGYYGASNPSVQDSNGDGLDDDGNPFPLGGDNEWDPAGPESALKLDNDLYQNRGTGPNLGCPPAITPADHQQVGRARRDRRDGALAPRRHDVQPRPRLGLAGAVAAVARPVGRRYAGGAAARLPHAQHAQGGHPADRRQQRVVRLAGHQRQQLRQQAAPSMGAARQEQLRRARSATPTPATSRAPTTPPTAASTKGASAPPARAPPTRSSTIACSRCARR